MKNQNLTCRAMITELVDGPQVVISGPRDAVLHVVARLADLDSALAVDVRRNPQSSDGRPWLIVDRAQASEYPAYLAEVVPTVVESTLLASLQELALSLEHGFHPAQREAGAELRRRIGGV
jgi:hypothetical protein